MESLSDPNVKPVISNENVKFTNEVSGQALCWNGNDERYIEFRTRNLERRLENKSHNKHSVEQQSVAPYIKDLNVYMSYTQHDQVHKRSASEQFFWESFPRNKQRLWQFVTFGAQIIYRKMLDFAF